MEMIILGMLMFKRFTIYEMRNYIHTNLRAMCSDSVGSIQATIKKLLANEMIIYNEYVENSVNKKLYEITDLGRQRFSELVQKPMAAGKMKNMELSKLYFMGLVPKTERIPLIDAYIKELQEELNHMHGIEYAVKQIGSEKEKYVAAIKSDLKYAEDMMRYSGHSSLTDSINDIIEFTLCTLEYGLRITEFELSWYIELRERMMK